MKKTIASVAVLLMSSSGALAATDVVMDSTILSAVQRETQAEIKSGVHQQRLQQVASHSPASTAAVVANNSSSSTQTAPPGSGGAMNGISSPEQTKNAVSIAQQQKRVVAEVGVADKPTRTKPIATPTKTPVKAPTTTAVITKASISGR